MVAAASAVALMALPTPGAGAATSPVQVANHLMTAVFAAKQWARLLYRLRPPAPAVRPRQVLPPVNNPDGGVTQVILLEDGTDLSTTFFPDESYAQQFRYPDGVVEDIQAAPEDFNEGAGAWNRFRFHQATSLGAVADYNVDFEWVEDPPEVWNLNATHHTGAFKAGGRVFDFKLDRDFVFFGPDRFTGGAADGTRLEMTVPLDFLRFRADLTQPTEAILSFQGKAFPFTLTTEAPGGFQWDHVRVGPTNRPPKPSESNGDFALASDYSGRGQMFLGRKLSFVARWNSKQIANVILPSGQAGSSGPTAGAIDFSSLRWSGLASGFGPSPGL